MASGGLEHFTLCCPFYAARLESRGLQSSRGQIPVPLTCGGLRVPPFSEASKDHFHEGLKSLLGGGYKSGHGTPQPSGELPSVVSTQEFFINNNVFNCLVRDDVSSLNVNPDF